MASLEPVPHQRLVQPDGHFRVADAATGPPETIDAELQKDPYMRHVVAEIIVPSLKHLHLNYP
ncbi:MAG: hypothetical protein V3U59_01470, partial [Gammaproteobacteria bacterium]